MSLGFWMAAEYVNQELQVRNECEDSDLSKRTWLERERVGNCETPFVTEGEQENW